MAAGVRDAGDRGAPRVRGAVLDRERIQVAAQGNARSGVPHLSQQARTREAPYPKPCLLEAARDHLGGARLGPGELRGGVQVPPDLDQLVGALIDASRDQTSEERAAGKECLITVITS